MSVAKRFPVLDSLSFAENDSVLKLSGSLVLYGANGALKEENGDRKLSGNLFVLNANGKVIAEANVTIGALFSIEVPVIKLSGLVTVVARASSGQDMVSGPVYNLAWEHGAARLKQQAIDKKKLYLYNPEEADTMSALQRKHLPVMSLNADGARVTFAHAKVKEDDNEHFIQTLFARDEFGRVIAFKELDRTLTDPDVFKPVDEHLELHHFANDFRTVTPYEYCSKDGLFQGPSIVLAKNKADL